MVHNSGFKIESKHLMDQFLIRQIGNSPGFHAIVIGVGEYPHLIGGNSPKSDHHGGMAQLTSPPVSARRVADWLLQESDHPEHPKLALSSLALLLSDAENSEYENPVDQSRHQIEPATSANVKKAIREWKARGDGDADNHLLFFCKRSAGG